MNSSTIKHPVLYLALSGILLLSSCLDFKHLSSRGKLLFKNKEKMFRGIQFGMSLQEVKEKEEWKPSIEYTDYLRYKMIADTIAAGEYIDVEYFFNKKDRLDMIIAFYNVVDKETIHPLVNEIKRYLERKHGRPRIDESGWFHWEYTEKGDQRGSIEINLIGETEEGYMGVELEMIKYYENEKRMR